MDNLEREQLKKEIREEMEYEEKVKRLREKNEKDMKKQQRNDKIKNNAPEFLTLIIWICCILGAVIIIPIFPQAILAYPAFLVIKALFRLIKEM